MEKGLHNESRLVPIPTMDDCPSPGERRAAVNGARFWIRPG